VDRDRKCGSRLRRHLRHSIRRQKPYATTEKRARLPGKRPISLGPDSHCIVTLIERITGVPIIGKLRCRKMAAVIKRAIELIQACPNLFVTITVDNRRSSTVTTDRGAPPALALPERNESDHPVEDVDRTD
jgi:IS30 family transposase